MSKKIAVPVDQYVYDLIKKSVVDGKAVSLSDAVYRGACLLNGIKYQPLSDVYADETVKQQAQFIKSMGDATRKTDIDGEK